MLVLGWYLQPIRSVRTRRRRKKGAQLGFAPASSSLTETQFASGSNFIPSPSSQSVDVFVLIEEVKYVSAHLDAAHEKKPDVTLTVFFCVFVFFAAQ